MEQKWKSWTGKMLEVGELVYFRGEIWEVEKVNECRARIRPLSKKQKKFQTVEGQVEFEGPGSGLDIAPNSDLERVEKES